MIVEMPKSELVSLWSKTQDSPFPANRSENSPLDAFYPITDYFVKIVDEKPVAGVGYSKRGEFTLFGGVFSIKRGEFSKLYNHFISNTTGPYIAGISSSTIPNKEWVKFFEKRGWSISPTEEELGEYSNNATIKAFEEYYSNHPKGAKWGIKGLSLRKMWQDILKKKKKGKATPTHNSRGEKKDRCAKLADKKYGMKSSAYKSGFIVKCRRGKVAKK